MHWRRGDPHGRLSVFVKAPANAVRCGKPACTGKRHSCGQSSDGRSGGSHDPAPWNRRVVNVARRGSIPHTSTQMITPTMQAVFCTPGRRLHDSGAFRHYSRHDLKGLRQLGLKPLSLSWLERPFLTHGPDADVLSHHRRLAGEPGWLTLCKNGRGPSDIQIRGNFDHPIWRDILKAVDSGLGCRSQPWINTRRPVPMPDHAPRISSRKGLGETRRGHG